MASQVRGEILLPATAVIGEKVEAVINANVPPGAEFKGGLSITCDNAECTAKTGEMKAPNTIGLWATKAGVYTVKYTGYWILLGPEIEVVDVNGKNQKFRPYLGSDRVDETAVITYTGGSDPPPPPPPPSNTHPVIVWETGDSSPQWARLKSDLRDEFDKSNKRLEMFDKDDLPASMKAVLPAVREAKVNLPALALVTDDGRVSKVMACPSTVEAVKKECGL
jgi:hypothetical protein